ncbi:hypothetical protein GC163_02870 [bacterium]|nr:hypothetical protein [bacterium]
MWNRRECLGAMTWGAIGSQLWGASPVSSRPWILAPQPGLFPGDSVAEQMVAAAEAGFTGFCDADLLMRSAAEQQEILQQAIQSGLQLGPVRRPVMPGLPTDRQVWNQILLPVCQQATQATVPGVRLSLGPQWTQRKAASQTPLYQSRAQFTELAATAKSLGLVLLLEPWDDGRAGQRHFTLCRNLIGELATDSIKLSVDTEHWLAAGADLRGLFRDDAGLVGHIELADFQSSTPMGLSAQDVAAWLPHLSAANYRGVIAVRHGLIAPGQTGLTAMCRAYRTIVV